ncbi:MAG: WHG domain-containing protein [Deltaproteobacteria bacterium]|nr:WHG domain-containing protein [Deltaproteobacteria bacterium]
MYGAGDAGAELEQMADAYRDNAPAWPRHYDLMFGRGVPDFEPSEASRAFLSGLSK